MFTVECESTVENRILSLHPEGCPGVPWTTGTYPGDGDTMDRWLHGTRGGWVRDRSALTKRRRNKVIAMVSLMLKQNYVARCLAAFACFVLTCANAPAEDYVPLFDGKTLKGWEGDEKVFRVQDGAIVGGNLQARVPRNEFLCATKQYGDFELRLKVKVVGSGANAGIQFRSRRVPNHHEMVGYQADVGDQWWGKLYDESRRRRVMAGPADPDVLASVLKTNDWNDYVIRCQGRRHRVLYQRVGLDRAGRRGPIGSGARGRGVCRE